ncbi:MAG: GTP-binding protein [Gemmataceae bacterium]
MKRDSEKVGTTGAGEIDLALLTDGLKAEREQGITIDVAYRYFSTDRRKFIIADTPGHEQYTRNMATGASTCQLAIILIDARRRRRRRRGGTRSSCRFWASSTSSSPSTRWTWSATTAPCSSGSRPTTPASSPSSTWATSPSSPCPR